MLPRLLDRHLVLARSARRRRRPGRWPAGTCRGRAARRGTSSGGCGVVEQRHERAFSSAGLSSRNSGTCRVDDVDGGDAAVGVFSLENISGCAVRVGDDLVRGEDLAVRQRDELRVPLASDFRGGLEKPVGRRIRQPVGLEPLCAARRDVVKSRSSADARAASAGGRTARSPIPRRSRSGHGAGRKPARSARARPARSRPRAPASRR